MNHAGPIGASQGTKNLPEPFRRLERPTRRGPGGRSLERQVLSHPVSGFPREVITHVGCADPPLLLAQEAAGLNFFTYPASRASKPPGHADDAGGPSLGLGARQAHTAVVELAPPSRWPTAAPPPSERGQEVLPVRLASGHEELVAGLDGGCCGVARRYWTPRVTAAAMRPASSGPSERYSNATIRHGSLLLGWIGLSTNDSLKSKPPPCLATRYYQQNTLNTPTNKPPGPSHSTQDYAER